MSPSQLRMALEVREHPHRGRGLWTTRLVRAGETLLSEEPLLLLVAQERSQDTCSNCLRIVNPSQCEAGRQASISAG